MVEWRVNKHFEDHLCPRHQSAGRMASKHFKDHLWPRRQSAGRMARKTFRGTSLSSSSALETLVSSPFGHLMRLLARKYYTEFSRHESLCILPLCRVHTLLFLGCLTRNAGNSLTSRHGVTSLRTWGLQRCENFKSRSLIQLFLPSNLFDLMRCTAHSQASELILGYV